MGKRILVADDSVTIQKAFAMVFGSQDVSLAAARSVDQALSSARQARPDLVIADAALGTGTGYDLCAALKGDAATRDVPVYILASTHVPYDDARGRQVGAAGHLLKPFDSQIIIDKVFELMRQPGPAETSPDMPAIVIDRPASARVAPVAAPSAEDENYGEISIEHSDPGSPAPKARPPVPVAAPVVAPAMPPPRPVMPPLPGGLRPSLIPGAQPGMSARLGGGARPPVPAVVPAIAAQAAAPAAKAPPARTMIGLPAASLPIPGLGAAPVPATARGFAPAPAPAPVAPVSVSPAAAAVTSAVAAKMTELSARGPEYEAIAKLSKEIIEQVVWEVVPELAELIIRQEVDRLAKK